MKPAIKDFEKQIDFEFDDVIEFTEKNEYDKMPLFSRDLKMAKNADFLVFYVEETSKNKAKKLLDLAKSWNKNLVNMT